MTDRDHVDEGYVDGGGRSGQSARGATLGSRPCRVTDGGSDAENVTAESGAVVEQLSADTAFELLSNETRLSALRALFDATDPLSFSDLNDAVGTGDSGQFNYHLDRLRGVFIRKTPDGYKLTAEGMDVVGSLLAGPYTKTVEADAIPVDADCPYCEGTLAGIFDDDHVRVACRNCDRDVISLAVPPGTFEHYPREEWPLVAEQWTRQEFETAHRGFCPVCHGPIESTVEIDPDGIYDVFEAGISYACQRCGEVQYANVGACLCWYPAVVAFYHDRGVDITDTPVWEFEWAVQPSAEIRSTDPLRVAVPIEHDGDRLTLVVDQHADVVEEHLE
ncbi:winged helix-turn-helix domain-containing protein [Halorhabdus amylolytica]|uniref:winged helix-turn-helix domain-containing protein n=1 Tax=Halorhabdus amylolytica TaxID=2559573 RepID=UPI0010AA1AA8|nr:helix-turn-helix domain-containing protein [Halorhabdus amylolytica]